MSPVPVWVYRLLPACLLAVSSASAMPEATNSSWSVQVWQSEDGLPNNNVVGLAQTPDGYLWVANPSGLARFDGERFEEFPMGSIDSAYRDLRVRELTGGSGGALWLGVDPGNVIKINHGTVEVYSNGLPRAVVEGLVEDGEGVLWVTCHGGTLWRIKDRKITEATALESASRVTMSLATDKAGHLWLTQSDMVGFVRQGAFVPVAHVTHIGARLCASRDGGMWVCLGGHLIKCYDDGRVEDHGCAPDQSDRGSSGRILEDRTGAVWLARSSCGLLRYDGSNFESIPTSDRDLQCMLQDREGNVWIGTGGGGLNRLRPRPVVLEGRETGAPFQALQSVCQAPLGEVWATTQDGALVCWSQGKWTSFATNAALSPEMLTCVTSDREGTIWIGTSEHKLMRWRAGQVQTWDQNAGLSGRVLHALFVSHTGDLWITAESPDALQYLHDGKLTQVALPAGAHRLRTMVEDNKGDLWLGGEKGALLRVSNYKVTDESELVAEVGKTIRCLLSTKDGGMWIGFGAGGIACLKDGHLTRVTSTNGLYVDAINQIVSDNRGSVWFGSDRGIFRIRESELADLVDGQAFTVRSIHYGRSEGLPGVQARHDYWPGALSSIDGNIWMPMRSALAIIHPEKVCEDAQAPSILLDRVTVDDRIVAQYGGVAPVSGVADLGKSVDTLRLPPGHRRLEFGFTALSFGPPENIHFRYRLDGFDDKWRDPGALRTVSYSRLSAGNYKFRVIGCNSDGVWNERGVTLPFNVEPFLWQRWWFRSGALALFTCVVVAVVRYVSFRRLRMKLQALEQQAALDRERARIARDIHDDLGGSLTQVALLSGLALRDWDAPVKAGEHVRQISTSARQVIKSLDEIVWAVNPRNDTLPDLINYIGQYAVEFLRSANIRCRVKAIEHPPRIAMAAEVRHNLFLVVKESLNNIVRHARATEAWVRVAVPNGEMIITIEDNGCGFAHASDDAGADGLRNMRQRMEEIGGHFRFESAPGGGTRISLTYPLHVTHNNGKQTQHNH